MRGIEIGTGEGLLAGLEGCVSPQGVLTAGPVVLLARSGAGELPQGFSGVLAHRSTAVDGNEKEKSGKECTLEFTILAGEDVVEHLAGRLGRSDAGGPAGQTEKD